MTYFKFPAFLALLILVAVSCSSDLEKKTALLENGNTYFKKGEYKQAKNAYQKALEIDPAFIPAYEKLADTYLKLGDSTNANDVYAAILSLNPDNTTALLKLAEFEILSKKIPSAQKRIAKVLTKSPSNVKALELNAELLEQEGHYQSARDAYKKIIDIDPNHKNAYMGLARIEARLGHINSAEKSLKTATVKHPEDIRVLLALYRFYSITKKYDLAEAVLLNATEKHPDDSDLLIILGQFYFNRNMYDKSEAALNKAMAVDASNIKPYLAAADIFAAASKTEKAIAVYRKALSIEPDNLRLKCIFTRYLMRQGKIIEAEEMLTQVLSRQTEYFPALMLKAELLMMKEDYNPALALLNQLIEKEPRLDRLYLLKAKAQEGLGDKVAAIKTIKKTLAISPNNISAKLMLSNLYLGVGNFEAAQKENMAVFNMLHQAPFVRLIMGQPDDINKRSREKGIDSFDTIFKLASENPAGYLKVGQMETFKKKYDQLMDNFEAAFDKNPKLINIFTSIVMLHIAKEEYDLALKKCTDYLKRLEGEPSLQAIVYNLKGGIFLVQNKTDAAETAFNEAISANPNYLQPYFGLARLYLMNRKVDKAIAQYKTLLEKKPDQTSPHMMLGTLYTSIERPDLAEKAYREALQITPDFIPAANNLAYLLAEQERNLDEALQLGLKAKAQKPDDPFIKDTLGWIYYKMGLYAEALRELKESLQDLPDNASINYHIGMTYYKMLEFDKAQYHLSRALELNENFSNANNAKRILDILYQK